MEQYYNYAPYVLRPRFSDAGRVTLRQVDGIGGEERANPNTTITVSFTVRIKDLPRILGEENSMLMHISQESGASVSIAADMRNLINHNAFIDVWGLREHVQSAEQMILNLIREAYDEPPSFLPLSYHYVRHEVMVLPLDKAVHLLKENNIVKMEGDTCTWIEVDASKAWKTGAPREVHVHFYGAKKDIDVAVATINAIVSNIEPSATVKKNGALKKAGRLLLKVNRWMCIFLRRGGKRLWQGTKVSGKFVWKRMKSGCRKNGALKATSNFSHGKQVHRDYSVIGIRGDGRCLFRAVAHGARIRSGKPAPSESLQRELADELRARVADEFVKRREETEWFIEGDFDSHVSEMRQTHVWGGEPELLMASHVLQVPISVYMNEKDSGGLISIVEYGQEYSKKDPIRVLYDGFGHYDALHIP